MRFQKKVKKYRSLLVENENTKTVNNVLLDETVKRLSKIRYILEKSYDLDSEINLLPQFLIQEALGQKGDIDYAKHLEHKLLNLEVYCEAFYYSAFRIYKIFEQMKLKFQCNGVRDVRNQLIEHPEVLSQSFGTGNVGNGPTIKNARTRGFIAKKKDEIDVFQDQGLFVNFEEFINSLDNKITEVLQYCESNL